TCRHSKISSRHCRNSYCANKRRSHLPQGRTRAYVSRLAQWQASSPAMEMEQGKYRSIFRSVAQYQRSAAMKRVLAAAGKNIRTAADAWRKPQAVIPSEVEESLFDIKYREMSRPARHDKS